MWMIQSTQPLDDLRNLKLWGHKALKWELRVICKTFEQAKIFMTCAPRSLENKEKII